MNIEVIKSTEAPAVPAKRSKFAAQLLDALANVPDDSVLSLKPSVGKSIVGTKTGIGRIAKKAGFDTTSWDDGETIFVKVNKTNN